MIERPIYVPINPSISPVESGTLKTISPGEQASIVRGAYYYMEFIPLDSAYVRYAQCVRGPRLPDPHVTDNFVQYTKHTVLDTVNNLQWAPNYKPGNLSEKCRDGSCDDHLGMNFDKAASYCENLKLDNITDWRLPTLEEAMTTADLLSPEPIIPLLIPKHGDITLPIWTTTTASFVDKSRNWVMQINGVVYSQRRWQPFGNRRAGARCVRKIDE